MHILGIDYGQKRIGLAWVDTDLGVVLPFGQVTHEEFFTLLKKETPDQLVVGMPTGLDGGENENTDRVHAFAETIKKHVTTPITFVDERFTTAEASRMGGDASLDEKAAMLLLQTYLERRGK